MKPNETGSAFAVTDNHLRELDRDEIQRVLKYSLFDQLPAREGFRSSMFDLFVSRKPVGQHDHRIVRAHVAIDGNAVKALLDRDLERALKQIRFDRYIAGDKREHRRVPCSHGPPGRPNRPQGGGYSHPRLNHSRALADSADAHCRFSNSKFHRDFFSASICRHDRFGNLPRVSCRSGKQRRARTNSARDIFHRHRNTDPPRRTNQHIAVLNRERFARDFGHSVCIDNSLFARARVCIPGIHDYGAGNVFRRTLRAHFHRRSANLVGSKHSRNCGRNIGNNQSEIIFAPLIGTFAGAELFDVAKNGRAFKSARCANGAGDLFE